MKRQAALLSLCMITVVAVPAALAQGGASEQDDVASRPGTPITFYGRVWGVGQNLPMPMNTQFPWGEEDYSIGGNDNCNFPEALLGAGTDGSECGWHMYWFTTPGFISIKTANQFDGYEQLHNERGQTKDIYLDTSMKPTSTLYTSSDGHGYLVTLCETGICWNWDPGYQPAWAVESYIWHTRLPGEHQGSASEAPDITAVADRADDAHLVAHGKWGPQEAWSLDETIPHPSADGTVNEHFAEMEWDPAFVESGGVIPKEHDIIVEFWWSNEADDGSKYTIAQFTYNSNSGEDFPNNVVLPVRNPIDVELVFPRFVHEKLVILAVLNTPWGSYDVDLDSIDMQVTGPSGQAIQPADGFMERFLDVSVAHSGHYSPINVTWIWDYQGQDLAPGEYEIEISAVNWQHSASASTTATFTITEEGIGGETAAGVGGLLSFTDGQLEQFNEGAAAQAGDEDQDLGPESGADQEADVAEDSPAAGWAAFVMALVAVAVVRRR